jgi:hypothetical protein
MDRRVTALAALVLGTALALPGAGGTAAQEDQELTGPTQTGGLGDIAASLSAGPASDSDVGTDGNIVGPNGEVGVAGIPGVGVRVPGADSAIGTAPGTASTITGAPETATAPGAMAPTVTEETTDPLGSVLDEVAGEGVGNRGNAGADGTDSAVAGPAGSVPEPEEPAEPAPAPAADPADGGDESAAPVEAAPAAPAEGSAAAPAGDACGYPAWLDAQLALEADAALASTLDPDGDGIACEEAMY